MRVKKKSNAAKIRAMLLKGKAPAEIVAALDVSLQAVYNTRYDMKRAENIKVKKAVAKPESLTTVQVVTTPDDIQIGGNHYKKHSIQPWDAIHSWGLGFFTGNAVKYIARYKDKGGIEDIKKARHYLDKLVSMHEANNGEVV
jgi:hypothetical protein